MTIPALFRTLRWPLDGPVRRRSILIPVAVIIATAAIYTAGTIVPELLSLVLNPIGKHARIVPDDAELFVSVDLKKAADRDVRATLDQLLQYETGFITESIGAYAGRSEPPADIGRWAGRELSISTFPGNGYAIIIDVRDRRTAGQALHSYIADNPQATLLSDYLIIASPPSTARAIVNRIDNRRHNTLEQTTDYQQADSLNENRRPLATAFIRWSINDGNYARSYAALIGCQTTAWLFATAEIKANRIELAGHCPPTDGVVPPTVLPPPSTYAGAAAHPDRLHFNASFNPNLQSVTARTRDTGHPQYTLLNLITDIAVRTTSGRLSDIDQQVLQHLAGTVHLSIDDAGSDGTPSFQIALGVKSGHRQPLADTVAEIAVNLASAHGIQAAQPAPEGWTIRHPVIANQQLSLTVTDRFLSVTNHPELFPVPAAATEAGQTIPRRFANRRTAPAHANLHATGAYAAGMMAYGIPQVAGALPPMSQIDYAIHNSGAMLFHRATLTLQTAGGEQSTED